jgi:hypothetical protein
MPVVSSREQLKSAKTTRNDHATHIPGQAPAACKNRALIRNASNLITHPSAVDFASIDHTGDD